MLAEIITGLTKAEESKAVISEQVLILARRVEAQRAQSATTSQSETKKFDKIKTIKGGQRHNMRKLQTHAKKPEKQSCSYCGSNHPPRQYLVYGKKCVECGKVNHFRSAAEVGEIEPSMT